MIRISLFSLIACLAAPGVVLAQDLEPRRWTHLPIGTNVTGLTYAYTEGKLTLDPVLQIEDATVDSHTLVAAYSHSFDCFSKTGRLDVLVPYQDSTWTGLLAGAPATRQRTGLSDPWLRLSVDLVGAPALKGEEFQRYRAAHPVDTIVGAALAVGLPLGDYQAERLLNLGQNRFTFRPQVGVVHTRGSWSYELTTSVFLFTANDEFFGGTERTQDPLYEAQSHVIHTFPNRWWASAGAGYSRGGASEIDGDSKDDTRSSLLSGLSVGLPVGKTQSLKLVYLRSDTLVDVGSDTDGFFLAWSIRF